MTWQIGRRLVVLTTYMTLLGSGVSNASMTMQVCGEAAVTSENAPIRADYPDGRILVTVQKGFKIHLFGMSGDGRGMWVQVNQEINGKLVQGFIDADMTTIMDDWSNGKLRQVCPS